MLYGKTPFFHENMTLMYGKILEEDLKFPKELEYSQESQDFIMKLLRKSGQERIGYDDEQEIFTHSWFHDIDFTLMIKRQMKPPIIPTHDDKLNVSPQADLRLSFTIDPKELAICPANYDENEYPDFEYFADESKSPLTPESKHDIPNFDELHDFYKEEYCEQSKDALRKDQVILDAPPLHAHSSATPSNSTSSNSNPPLKTTLSSKQ